MFIKYFQFIQKIFKEFSIYVYLYPKNLCSSSIFHLSKKFSKNFPFMQKLKKNHCYSKMFLILMRNEISRKVLSE